MGEDPPGAGWVRVVDAVPPAGGVVEARIELPPESVQPEFVYSDSDTEMY